MVQSMHMSPDGETEIVLEKPKRAPRKRVSKVALGEAETKAPVKRAPRKKAPRDVEAPAPTPPTKPSRKAPTPLADERKRKIVIRRHTVVVAVLITIGVIASAVVGFTDPGQIDVVSAIEERNRLAKERGESITIPVQSTAQEVDGGLIGLGDNAVSQTATTTPELVATTTEPTASSTEIVGQVPMTEEEAQAAAAISALSQETAQ